MLELGRCIISLKVLTVGTNFIPHAINFCTMVSTKDSNFVFSMNAHFDVYIKGKIKEEREIQKI